MQHNILSYDFAKCTFFQEEYGKLIQFIERMIGGICPVECELIPTIWIIGKIASVNTIGTTEYNQTIRETKSCDNAVFGCMPV